MSKFAGIHTPIMKSTICEEYEEEGGLGSVEEAESKLASDHEEKYVAEKKEQKQYAMRSKRLKNLGSRKRKGADSFIAGNKKRMGIAEEIQKRARQYKIAFNRVETICDHNLEIPGAIAQVMGAINDNTDIEHLPEVVDAADCYAQLQESITLLINDGVPGIVGLELSRRVLEEDIPDSQEYTVYMGR